MDLLCILRATVCMNFCDAGDAIGGDRNDSPDTCSYSYSFVVDSRGFWEQCEQRDRRRDDVRSRSIGRE